jgi:hypothetical protein
VSHVNDARLWHPWLRCCLDGSRINRVLRVMLHTRWSAEAWAQVRVEFKKALAKMLSVAEKLSFDGGNGSTRL